MRLVIYHMTTIQSKFFLTHKDLECNLSKKFESDNITCRMKGCLIMYHRIHVVTWVLHEEGLRKCAVSFYVYVF
jgi:hypothetical protein